MHGLIGRGPTSSVWHIVRRPQKNEGLTIEDYESRPPINFDRSRCIDRGTHRMSLCSLVWEIVEVKIGEPTCKTCLKQLQLINHPCRHDNAAHRRRQKRSIVWCP